ncbi:MAG TPA: FxsA family protein [Acidimicrobiales bacterium]|nr:FxsA family protein [Acidimicrobiales bacterium]
MFFLGFLLFVGAEIAAFVVVAQQIGFLWALGILILVSALGPFVVRRVGIGVMVQTQQRLARGEVPTWGLLDGLVVLVGGVMICVPGFIGDTIGLLLMIGPLRRLLVRAAGLGLARRVQTIRIGSRWVTNASSRTIGDPPSPPTGRSAPPLGPGDDIEL